MDDIFKLIKDVNIELLKEKVNAISTDINQYGEHGFTPLHIVGMNSNGNDTKLTMEMLEILIQANASLELQGKNDKRTALYFLAEFSPSIEPIKYLLDKGANPNVYDNYGNHIVVNSMEYEVQKYLSDLTNYAIPKTEEEVKEIPLSKKQWKRVKSDLDIVFKQLNNSNIVSLQNAGYTQQDAINDCLEEYNQRKEKNKLEGYCFYTRQDSDRAKNTGILPIGFSSYSGVNENDLKIGKLVLEVFKKNGFTINWDEISNYRLEIILYNYADK